MQVYKTDKLIVKSWCDDLDSGTIDQAKNLARLPFAFHHVALMPDAHLGMGMPIGGVFATENAVVPNAVGVDIGCGMIACKTSIADVSCLSKDDLEHLVRAIKQEIPVGFAHHSGPTWEKHIPKMDNMTNTIVEQEYESAKTQLGTLGGGNHFIELQKGSDGHLWFMIHSGSRNVGKKVADYHDKLAKKLNQQWHTPLAPAVGLSFLPTNSIEGREYLREMKWCLQFAAANRKVMSDIISKILRSWGNVSIEESHAIHHNYASLEHHFGRDVWVHRKGAVCARKDVIGMIPGSQGSKSYIVRGLGNPESFESCSHGAGRKMSRTVAKASLDLKATIAEMDAKGIVHDIKDASDLDEAPGAYKDIDVVMASQTDLVEIMVELTPLAVVKG
jgi:tRNA-splicing ligase RtcB